MAIKLASLFFEIAANSDKLTAELKKGQNSTKTWAKQSAAAAGVVKDGFAAATAGFVTYQAALAAVYVTTASGVAEQQKLATRLDTTYANLKLLSVAAKAAAVDQDGINDTLADFTERLGEARVDGGEPAEALDLLRLSAEELAAMDPADALREVLEAMESLPDAGVRAATGAKLFGDEGIKITGLLSEQFEQAEQKINSLGGALTELEATQITEASAAVGDLNLVVDLAREKLTAKMAPAVAAVAEQLFESAQQGAQLYTVMDGLVIGSIEGFATVADTAEAVLRYIDGREEVATYGVLGYLMFGKKGLVVGALAGNFAGSIKSSFDVVFELIQGGTTQSIEFVEAEIERLENKLKLRKTPGLDLIFGDQGDANIEARIQQLTHQLVAMGGEGASALDETRSFAASAADGFELLSATLDNVLENYGKLGEVAASKSLVAPNSLDTVLDSVAGKPAVNDALGSSGESGQDDPIFTAYQEYQATMQEARDLELEQLQTMSDYRQQYFAGELHAAQAFQKTWTMFQEAGAADRFKILSTETSGAMSVLSEHSRSMFELNKAVGLANATVYIAEGIAASWKLGWPVGAVAAATVALNGAAQIRAITSAKFGAAEVAQPTTDSSSIGSGLTTDVSSSNSSIAANDSNITVGSDSQANSGAAIFLFHSPGATAEQRADEYAQAFQAAQDNDLLVPDGNGSFLYTGSGASNYVAPVYEAVG